MPVVINELEVAPASEPAPHAPRAESPAPAPPAPQPADVELWVECLRVREERVRAH